jgi:REP element-mobilizing transposase RayT
MGARAPSPATPRTVSTMTLWQSPHKTDLKKAGWHSRGYLPHFDGSELPQFVTLRLYDSVPNSVLIRWHRELNTTGLRVDQLLLRRRIEHYLDQGYGQSFLRNPIVATTVQNDLLSYDGNALKLFAWVVMPNHLHLLATRYTDQTLAGIMQSFKSLTSHKANNLLKRIGRFWMADYFDRYIRNAEHFVRTVQYIESNPVKAKLCARPEDWPFSSANRRHPHSLCE